MSAVKPQSFRNHASFDPSFHVVTLGVLACNLLVALSVLFLSLHTHLWLAIWVVVLSLGLIILAFKVRIYPLKVQDRLIRLEERLRLSALLPASLHKRIPELTEDQLIGLRFAPDEEIPTLVELTLEKNLNRKQIKERIQNWRPDHFRV